jgi:hypothetical protein
MTTAARFGSRDDAFAHRMISFAQCWTSCVKMGERLVEEGLFVSIGRAEVGMGALNESAVNKQVMRATAKMGRE